MTRPIVRYFLKARQRVVSTFRKDYEPAFKNENACTGHDIHPTNDPSSTSQSPVPPNPSPVVSLLHSPQLGLVQRSILYATHCLKVQRKATGGALSIHESSPICTLFVQMAVPFFFCKTVLPIGVPQPRHQNFQNTNCSRLLLILAATFLRKTVSWVYIFRGIAL